ncbi:myosin phosphatase Rho-interacting protein isoform X4 [Falco rusticolus]|uniref:myosin phosphatase Rho-interacting protein isoform X4 n=1 Tax=Falco rusticolus TaxID=120794 RepID=UPI001886A107|nr:myosin phosphatase Rho-interacting protein isoform X4 [Falco rusticolus]XP_055566075.1 myosin phosphatase Rho-interacting protein isoform X5 [Falco cherrug]
MAAKDNPCRKFQANIFNKSKCQNCFKPRESHLLNDEDLNQAKPIYGGWLLLAPEGTDFDNPVHRSRKWQRRFFILYEHGLLRYALDEMPTTLPQGTINMNQCTDVVDGESRTGQKFSLCILTPEKEHFIRAENKEIISGWLEMLIVYPRTNKQNQKKKRKVEPPTPQEPGPAKMAVTSSNIPSAEKVPATKSTLWQEEMRGKDQADGSSSISPAQSPVQGQAGAASSLKDPVLDSKEDESSMNGERIDCGRKTRVESGYFSLEKTKQDSKLEEQQLPPPPSPPSPSTPNNRRSQVIEKFEALDIENAEHMETNVSAGAGLSSETRQGRSEKRVFPRKRDFACEGAAVGAILDVSASPLSPHRRAKSLDRRSTESSMTPDLLNFKKGWLTKQYEDGQWKKHWFVLTDQSLRYYRDSVAEEAADLDGEIDLSTCYDVTEYPVQRNYGFQIHTKEGEFTLSAMTSGIRRNWIQTIMKHVRPTTAPDVTSSLPEEKSKTSSSFETGPKPSEKPDAEQAELDPEQKRSRARERRREGRSKTFDWAEFRPIQQALVQERANAADSSSSGSAAFPRDTGATDADPGELERERARRREERRKRFEMIDTVDGAGSEEALRMEVDRILPVPADIKLQNVHVEIEQRWHQVETTPLREEKQIPITPLHLAHAEDRDEGLTKQHLTTLLEKELEQKQKEALELLEQNRHLQDQLKVALGREQSAREGYVLQTEVAASPSGAWQRLHKVNQDLQSELEAQCQRQELINQQIQSLKRSYAEAKDVIRHHEAEIQSLQARLSNAAAELSIKEQTLAKLKSDLRSEKEKAKEQLEEWQHSEATLSSQLKASEQKLKSAEALLLEKTQELRDLEMQQALQRDHQKEVQRLQDRIADLSRQLNASEQARILMEEKLQKNYEALLESCEREKQVLIRSLKEVEDKANEYENQLQNSEQQMEILQKEKLSAKFEGSELVHQLEEQLVMKEASIQKLAEHIKELERERDQIKCRFHELMNQVAESDNEVAKLQAKLKMEETNYHNLEQSFEEVSDQFQGVQEVLKEKEEELRHVKEMHLRIVEKKDQDLSEALVKMVALDSSLEETKVKLKAKEEALKKLAGVGTGLCAEEVEDLGPSLEADESHPSQPGQTLQTQDVLPALSYALKEEDDEVLQTSQRQAEEFGSPSKAVELQDQELVQKALAKPDVGIMGAKRQRIRFSSIQCQKYIHPDGSEKNWTSSTSSDTSQDRSLSEESMSSEPALGYPSSGTSDSETYLSIIHSLETKLYITEEKLKDVTMKLESQHGHNQETLIALHHQWASTESQLREQLQTSLSQVSSLISQLESERQEKFKLIENHVSELGSFQMKNDQALTCLEKCREQLRSLPESDKEKEGDLFLVTLSSMETTLSNAIYTLRGAPVPSEYQQSDSLITEGSTPEGVFLGEEERVSKEHVPKEQRAEMFDASQLRWLSERVAFEASLINQIAESLKNASSEISQLLREMQGTAEVVLLEPANVSHTAVDLASVLSKKLLLEGEFWSQVEELRAHLSTREGETEGKTETTGLGPSPCFLSAVADATLVKAELGFVAQKMRESFHQRLKTIEEDLHNTKTALQQHKCMLEEIIKAYRTPDFDGVMHQISEALEIQKDASERAQISWDGSCLQMVPCQELAKVEEIGSLPECSSKALVSIQEDLAQQLKDKANVLKEISVALLSLPPEEAMRDCQKLLKISESLSYHSCMGDLERYSSLLVHDAVVQAQVCYAACKVRLEYEREMKSYKESLQSMDALCQERVKTVSLLRDEYEDLLRKQQGEYGEVIAMLERENADLKAKVSQLDSQRRLLEEEEHKHSKSLSELQGRYEEEIRNVIEQLNRTEDALKAERTESLNQLDAIVRDKQNMERYHLEQMQMLEDKFQAKIKELQVIHGEELQALQEHYSQNLQRLQETLDEYQRQHPEASPTAGPGGGDPWVAGEAGGTGQGPDSELDSMHGLRERIQELEAQMNVMRDELENKHLEGNASTLREKYQKDFENLKATCERGFAAMEETHQKKIEDLQRQHQRELEKLREEKDRLLAEETAATISAIEAMKNAHREELERELEKSQRSQISSVNADIEALRRQYLEELQSVQRELEVLSEQYSQKCLENAHLAQALEAERQALRQCQRENQELNAHNQELNNRLAAEITRLRTLLTGEGGGEAAGSPLTQGKDAYELEVLLRVKESEIQYLKQEISSLKDELQTALRDKKYASDKYKDIYTELSIVKAKADCDISRLKEQLKAATEAQGEKSPVNTTVSGYDIMKSKSNPDFLKKDRSSVSRQLRNIRSKSLKEGLTVQERLKLFESRDLKKD